MTTEQLQSVLNAAAFPGATHPAELVETHISWVILTPDFAFKIKKPVAFGFLDFSTLEKRYHFCREEMRLNRRLAPDMYLDVLPVALVKGQATIGAAGPEVLDYALQMRRMDNNRQMDLLLAKHLVSAPQLHQLAAVLAAFHRQVRLTGPVVYHPGEHWADFAEIYRFGPDIERWLGPPARTRLQEWRDKLPAFLEQHSARLIERVRRGYWVDGHGDLHTRNIFLPESGPVVFDCIEFNPHFRQNDILNELAFLCMDLDVRQQPESGETFLQAYDKYWPLFPLPEDRLLFLFFKAYRASVRLKVSLLELRQHGSPVLETQVRLYWRWLERYVNGI